MQCICNALRRCHRGGQGGGGWAGGGGDDDYAGSREPPRPHHTFARPTNQQPSKTIYVGCFSYLNGRSSFLILKSLIWGGSGGPPPACLLLRQDVPRRGDGGAWVSGGVGPEAWWWPALDKGEPPRTGRRHPLLGLGQRFPWCTTISLFYFCVSGIEWRETAMSIGDGVPNVSLFRWVVE